MWVGSSDVARGVLESVSYSHESMKNVQKVIESEESSGLFL